MSLHTSIQGLCACGSRRSHADCCGRYLHGNEQPATAEALMRSRYSAYVLGRGDYLLQTWHLSTRPAHLMLERESVQWLGLQVLAAIGGNEHDNQGTVEFSAVYQSNGMPGRLHERSLFVREAGRWYYLNGELQVDRGTDSRPAGTGRNVLCPCGSGKKYKRCCGR